MAKLTKNTLITCCNLMTNKVEQNDVILDRSRTEATQLRNMNRDMRLELHDLRIENAKLSNRDKITLDRVDVLMTPQHMVGCFNKITRIKIVREITGCGLKEAKEFIERYDATMKANSQTASVESVEDAETYEPTTEHFGAPLGDILSDALTAHEQKNG